jgi:hypothetical protein
MNRFVLAAKETPFGGLVAVGALIEFRHSLSPSYVA